MNDEEFDIPEDIRRLIDSYLDGELDEATTADLDRALRQNAPGRAYFVRVCKMETDLHAAMHAQSATSRAMASIGQNEDTRGVIRDVPAPVRSLWRPRARAWLAASVLLVIAAALVAWFARPGAAPVKPVPSPEIAWLINAQDCQWDATMAGGLVPGRSLGLRRGLAELRMANGATVVMEGPAQVELLGRDVVRVAHGKLAVRAEADARGFQVLLPQGRVLDLGTEFGVSVNGGGSAKLMVFEGKVQASAGTDRPGVGVTLTQAQSARVSRLGVKVDSALPPATQPPEFTRRIKPTPLVVARRLRVNFVSPPRDTLFDANGAATGLTHRLPGTGEQLPLNDPNLRLDASSGSLWLTATRSDLNHRFKLSQGEYLGLRLSDLGFTGDEDFEVSVVVPDIPALAAVGQFGLYAGVRNDLCIRGGLISQRSAYRYSQFFVNDEAGIDRNAMFVGLIETGNDLRLTLRRRSGSYSLTVENLTSRSSSTLSIPPLETLAGERQMYVGFFGASRDNDERQTLSIADFSATVWTRQ